MLDLQRSLFLFVGVPGFEPGTPWSQTRCASRAALHPEKYYFFLERVLFSILTSFFSPPSKPVRRGGDSNPRYSFPYGSLANCWYQPLTHLSRFLGGANVGIIFTWAKLFP